MRRLWKRLLLVRVPILYLQPVPQLLRICVVFAGTLSPLADDGTFVGWSKAEMQAAVQTANDSVLHNPALYDKLLVSICAAVGVDHVDVMEGTLRGQPLTYTAATRKKELVNKLLKAQDNTINSFWKRGQAMLLDIQQVVFTLLLSASS
jgi:cell division protein YceG involved in septum cleavage